MLANIKFWEEKAQEGKYAIPHFNVWNAEMLMGVIDAGEEAKAPIIISFGTGFVGNTSFEDFSHMMVSMAKKASVPVITHWDHGRSLEIIQNAYNHGMNSVMRDASAFDFEENIRLTKEAVDYFHPLGIPVEAELGHVGQSEDYSSDVSDHFTKPEEVKKFVEETGIDCLAVAIGTAHGRYHGTPHIDFDLLKQITDVVDIPLVLHGGSGTGDENLRKAVKNGIQKVNLATELVVAGKEELETFIQDKNFDKWQLIPSFIKGYSDRLEHYVKLFDQENRAW